MTNSGAQEGAGYMAALNSYAASADVDIPLGGKTYQLSRILADPETREQFYTAFLKEYSPGLKRVVSRITGSGDADDIAGQTILSIYQHLPEFAGTGKFSSWVYRIATNAAKQHSMRNKKLNGGSLDDENMPDAKDERDSAETSLIRQEEIEIVTEEMQNLPEHFRNAIYLFDIEGATGKEAARTLKTSEQSVKNWLLRGRRQLKENISKRLAA